MSTTPAPDGWAFPEEWSAEALEMAAEVLAQRADLSGAEVALLENAGWLLTQASIAFDVAKRHAFESTTDRGAITLHPGLAEARQARLAANAALHKLVPHDSGAAAGTIAGASLARRRWSPR
ncbi:hypothetical protein [Isoptericola jiangsuensis]|uniref:hypothetical protein n=1 Tax=Isoptericola jiangsuensis TaxID=548579 RepID=UPI000BF344FE|nr:hypothetical protein [Isoptericola jiangsuensis]